MFTGCDLSGRAERPRGKWFCGLLKRSEDLHCTIGASDSFVDVSERDTTWHTTCVARGTGRVAEHHKDEGRLFQLNDALGLFWFWLPGLGKPDPLVKGGSRLSVRAQA